MTGDYIDLFNELHSGTVSGRVNWQSTAGDEQFVVYFEQAAVTTRFFTSDNGVNTVKFTLHDPAGKTIDQFYVYDSEEEWERAWEMYSGARRRARGIDTALQTILAELKSGNVVGKGSEPTEDDGEDVPF